MSWSTGSPVRALLGRFLIALLIASVFTTGVVVAANRKIDDQIAKIPRIPLALATPPPGGSNFLLIGSDTRAFVDTPDDATKFGDSQTEGGQRSDTIMVAHVEPGSQRTFVVSFPRDLIVNIPGYGRGMINSAYSLGTTPQDGAQLLIDTLDANFGIKINHYVQVDFRSFRSVVDTIGRVWVYIPGKMRDLESGLNTPYGGGCYPLSGDAALSYVRSRYPEIYDSTYTDANGEHWRPYGNWSDLERIPRQQSFIRKLAALAISKSLGDPFLALELTDNVLKYLKVDQALGRTEINDLVKAFKTVDVNDPTSLEMITLPVVADPDDPNRVIPGDGSDAVVAQLNTFGDSAPKALPAPSQVSVDVVDASGRDLGVAIVKSLGDQGFVAKAKGTATATTAATTATATVTEIRYAPGQLEEAEALLAYLPNAKFVPDPAATKAVKLVIGSDFVNLTLPTTTTTAAGQVAAPTTTTPLPTTTTVPPGQVCGQG